ncbi:ankyrin [Parachaetomium inaequale]|uniref:Ankyrin n=1 Tax=Parachaetomium inaequale TaxID=2588326 RepID=A0AAN6PL73_9PEZI|nr:ankyrin [Parachaetomium inaequale]
MSQDPGNDTLVSEPAERGTPRAALVDALFSDDVVRCRQLLDAHPELVNTPLRHQAYNRVHVRDSAWGVTGTGTYQPVTPVVFASLVPRFREKDLDSRALSSAGLAIIVLLVERRAALEISPRHSYRTSHLLTEVCRDYDSPEALGLLAAAGRGAVGAVGFLLDRGIPMNHTSGQDNGTQDDEPVNGTPLNWAAENGRFQVVRLLLSRGALSDMETLDWHGRTPLLCAARGLLWKVGRVSPLRDLDREETIRLLVDAGADLTASDRQDLSWSWVFGERSPFADSQLGHVSSWGGADIIRYLVGKGSDIHQQRSYPTDGCFPYGVGGDKATPLHRAAHNWNEAAVQALLDLGADPGVTDEHGRQPLHWAAMGRCLSEGRPRFKCISWTWSDLQTEPRSPAFSERLAALESSISHLIDHNAAVDRQDAFGRTPLHYAAYMKQAGAVAQLIQHGADPGLPDHDGLDATVADTHLAITLAGWLQGADKYDILNHRDSTGATALHLAARAASDTALALLLTLGADPNLKLLDEGGLQDERGGATALHLAARRPSWVSLGTYEAHEYAAWSGRAARIKGLLLGAGADAGTWRPRLRRRRARSCGGEGPSTWSVVWRARRGGTVVAVG